MSIYESLNFQPMLITDVFETLTASKSWYDKSALNTKGVPSFPFVSRTKSDNGVDGFCVRQEKDPEPGIAITIGLDTQTVGYQPVPFYTSQNIQVLRHPRLTLANATVLMTVIAVQLRKFSWGGNGATLGRLKATKIMVPATVSPDGETVVDWEGMTAFGEELLAQVHTHTHRARPSDATCDDGPPELSFEPMLITDVFETYRQAPVWLNLNEARPGLPKYPHVSNSASANSIAGFVGEQEESPNPGNAITVGIDTQVVAYQPVAFYGATKVFELRSSSLNEWNALTLVTSLKRALEKFSWGHKASATRLAKTRFMVPVIYTPDGLHKVDWDGMEQYSRWLASRVCNRMNEVIGEERHENRIRQSLNRPTRTVSRHSA